MILKEINFLLLLGNTFFLHIKPIYKKTYIKFIYFIFLCSTRLYDHDDDDDDDGIFKTCTYLIVPTYKHSTIQCEYF